MPDTEIELIDKNNLISELRSCNPNKKEIIILDCRSANDYAVSHIKHSANISIPTIMLRRLKEGKIDLFSTIKCKDLKNRIVGMNIQTLFVLYHNSPALNSPDIIHILSRKLMAEFNDKKIRVVCLADGFPTFQSAFPEWCEDERTNNMQSNSTEQLMGLRSLRISTPLSDSACSSSTESSDNESASNYPLEPYGGEPIEILPGLFLGNAAHSEDLTKLQKYNIRYILNVSTLPNVFQDTGKVEYLQIPITDHWSQDLSIHFPSAIKFIEEAKAKNVSCLVHCLAGVSRSVTITLAYLMYAKDLGLNEAFTFVRARKPDISPNFHFMEQLYTFERQLKNDPNRRMNVTSASSSATTPSSFDQSNTPSSATSSVSSSMRDNRSMRYRQIKYSCACNECECKCMQQEFLLEPMSHMSHIGVSPDSGIEFDLRQNWTPSDNNTTPK
jgi:rhodanese-related sulfurtransferase